MIKFLRDSYLLLNSSMEQTILSRNETNSITKRGDFRKSKFQKRVIQISRITNILFLNKLEFEAANNLQKIDKNSLQSANAGKVFKKISTYSELLDRIANCLISVFSVPPLTDTVADG